MFRAKTQRGKGAKFEILSFSTPVALK